jgi:hypothetical protein
MAVRNIAVTDTIEKFRTEFNAMTLNDFGDIGTLSASISATTIVGAVNECIQIISSTAGWTMVDSSSTTQIVGGGQQAHFLGTSNEIEAVVSGGNNVTIGLPDAVSITTSLTAPTLTGGTVQITGNTISVTDSTVLNVAENITATGNISGVNITGTGSTHTLGTVEISGNTIRSTDSTRININDTFRANTFETQTGLLSIDETSGFGRISSTRGDDLLVLDAIPVLQGSSIIFEGATADNFETNLTVTDPTADRTITFPDATGTVALTNGTGYATSTIFSSAVSLIIYNSAGVAQKTIYGSAS